MKLNFSFFIGLVLSGCFYTRPALGFWTTVPLDKTHIVAEAPFIQVVSRQLGPTNEPILYFTIFVSLRDNAKGELVSGTLTVGDRHGTNAESYLSTPIQGKEMPDGFAPNGISKSQTGKWKAFSVIIGTRLLAQSEFNVGYTIDPKWGSAGTYYVLKLKEFADKNE